MLEAIVVGASRAALAVIARFATEALLKRLLAKLFIDTARALAKRTDNTTDDEIVEMLADELKAGGELKQ